MRCFDGDSSDYMRRYEKGGRGNGKREKGKGKWESWKVEGGRGKGKGKWERGKGKGERERVKEKEERGKGKGRESCKVL